ncbi:hypothetical protein ACWEIJ_17950 [Lentzea sp. NPDC004789]
MRAALLAAALLVATAAPASAADTDYLIWDSDPNAITNGRSGNWAPPEVFSVWEHPGNMIRVKANSPDWNEYLQIDLTRHDGLRITEGAYVDQKVLVVNRGLGRTDNGGEFTVEHIAWGPDGQISEFDGAVEHHASDQPDTTFRAKLHYRR